MTETYPAGAVPLQLVEQSTVEPLHVQKLLALAVTDGPRSAASVRAA